MANKKNVIEIDEATFAQDVISKSADKLILVDFWAPWCGPCRQLGPVLERLAGDETNNFILAKLNVDENPEITQSYGVRGIPAVKAFYNGKIVGEFVGSRPEPMVKTFLDESRTRINAQ